jgi:acetyl-CoA carboxylase biotin carboxyl carrier protein
VREVFELTNRDLADLLEAITQSRVTSFHLKTPDYEVSVSCLDDGAMAQAEVARPEPAAALAGPAPAPLASTHPQPVSEADPAAAKRMPDEPAAGAEPGAVAVTAPMVGAYYVASEPGAPPYVEPGTTVTPDTTVGLIEAMKVFTAVTAGVHGVVSAVLVGNGDFVEYGQDLVLVVPSDGEDDATA